MRSKFFNYLFWLVIAAAFIGPGTVTTAASAGASFQYQLIWAMVFSTIACLVLQEAAARVAIVTGHSLGAAIRNRFQSSGVVWVIACSILLGCIAYEAGNILGAISGIALLLSGVPIWIFTLLIGFISFMVLWWGKSSFVANFLGMIVAIMGLAFFVAAFTGEIEWKAMAAGTFLPSIPDEGILITLGLIGTTIVPYNIFLGSSLAKGQSLPDMRKGLAASIILGGLISIAVIMIGAQLCEAFSFGKLYEHLKFNNGPIMAWLFAVGLFAAGFTSTITASLAGALTIKSVHPRGESWSERSASYRSIWLIVIIIGVGVGVSDVRPIPVIILAQAANGLILPLLTFVIWVIVNSSVMGREKNGIVTNALMAITLTVTTVLGLLNVIKAGYGAIGETFELTSLYLMSLGAIAVGVVLIAIFVMSSKTQKE